MATSLADPSPAQERQPPDADANGSGAAPDPAAPAAPAPASSACSKCGAAMAPGQDWCLQCGAGAPGSVGSHAWRPWAIVLGATAVLLLGAAAAAYAALSKEPKKAAVVTATVAQVTPPAATTTPAPATTPTPTPTTPVTKVPPIAKAPVLPTKAVAPPVTTPATTTPANPSGGTTGEQKTSTTGSGQGNATKAPEPLLLDTDAASTYNPYNYPATGFGDPSLTIDGDTSTGWSAQVNPSTAPAMAAGVAIDLKSPKKLSAVKLVTSTPGITLQVYGANTQTAPASITDKAWVPISHSLTIRKTRARVALQTHGKAYRFIVVWISGAPESSVGTPEAPGKVTLNEIEVFPTA